jgi:hypothetical protein
VNPNAHRCVGRTAAVLLTFLISLPLHAQDAGATLSGTVTDASGKTVPGAKITIKNVATGQIRETLADLAGSYTASNLTPGNYEFSVTAPGFTTAVTPVSITAGGRQTINLTLRGMLGLEDLGFTAAQVQGNTADQALLDKRSHMLKLHQRYGLIAIVPLVAAVVSSGSAGGRNSSASGRNLHAALGITAAGFYSMSAYYAIAAPKMPGIEAKGHIRLHKALAWVHGPGMILTPLLGEMAYEQRKRGEKVHGIASAHGGVAVATVVAYAAAILTESLK